MPLCPFSSSEIWCIFLLNSVISVSIHDSEIIIYWYPHFICLYPIHLPGSCAYTCACTEESEKYHNTRKQGYLWQERKVSHLSVWTQLWKLHSLAPFTPKMPITWEDLHIKMSKTSIPPTLLAWILSTVSKMLPIKVGGVEATLDIKMLPIKMGYWKTEWRQQYILQRSVKCFQETNWNYCRWAGVWLCVWVHACMGSMRVLWQAC